MLVEMYSVKSEEGIDGLADGSLRCFGFRYDDRIRD